VQYGRSARGATFSSPGARARGVDFQARSFAPISRCWAGAAVGVREPVLTANWATADHDVVLNAGLAILWPDAVVPLPSSSTARVSAHRSSAWGRTSRLMLNSARWSGADQLTEPVAMNDQVARVQTSG
jgi:phage tail protein X